MTVALPEVKFVETDSQKIIDSIIGQYEKLTGRKLADADPVRLLLLSYASTIIQLSVIVNDTAKQNLLYYSRDAVLDQKGYAWNTPRLGNDCATTTMRFVVATSLVSAKIIPKGTLVTANGKVLFKTETEAVIPPGSPFVDVAAICITPGKIGNGYEVGEIDTMIEPLSYIQTVQNLTLTEGGTDKESNESYRNRIQQAPEKMAVAGPTEAYEYHAKSASAAIADVYAYSPQPGHVDVRILLESGVLPGEEIVSLVQEKLNDRKIRPLTDLVTVGAPEVVLYDIDMTYYIDSNVVNKTLHQQTVEKAVQDYQIWQNSKIGRNINPSRLIAECINAETTDGVKAGAKRVVINAPDYTVLDKRQVAQLRDINVVFGGLEDD